MQDACNCAGDAARPMTPEEKARIDTIGREEAEAAEKERRRNFLKNIIAGLLSARQAKAEDLMPTRYKK